MMEAKRELGSHLFISMYSAMALLILARRWRVPVGWSPIKNKKLSHNQELRSYNNNILGNIGF